MSLVLLCVLFELFFFADLSICSGYFSLQRSIQKEEAKKKEVHIDENVPAPSPRSNCSVRHFRASAS